jgi:WD40 repeat protein
VGFPPSRRGNIFKAAAQGRLEIVQDLVAYGASVNAKDKSGSTPLFLATRARNIDVCRWLLEHGAEVDDRCTKQSLTALQAAVANDDVELALLFIADHDADIYVRTSTGKTMQTLMEENGSLNVRKAFPPEFWKHELPPPRHPKAFGDFDPGRVPNHLKKVGKDWSVVFNEAAPRVLDLDLLHTLEHDSVTCCVKFSHDGKYVATGCNRSTFVYDVASGEKLCVLQDENIDLAADLYIRSVCFSPDGKYLATGDEGSLVKVSLISSKFSFRQRYTNTFRSGISKHARSKLCSEATSRISTRSTSPTMDVRLHLAVATGLLGSGI